MSFARMKWGMICSIDGPEKVEEFEKFGKWMVNELERTALRLHLGHCFMPTANFIMYAIPGSFDEASRCYEQISQFYPEVSYVIHVLPSKDSLEFKLLKQMTMAGALIGQGVLAENALNYFSCYQLDEVMYNMNQWIARRLSQIMARPSENKSSQMKGDTYRMLITNKSPTCDLQRFSDFDNNRQHRYTSSNNNYVKNRIPTTQDIEYSVGIVLHKRGQNNNYICEDEHVIPPPSSYDQQAQKLSDHQKESQRKESASDQEVIVKGFPHNFNKFQIASLFSDFRPYYVEYLSAGEAIVQFANRFHAAQVVTNYNGRLFEDEHFTLEVSSTENTRRKVLQEKLKELQAEVHANS